MGRMMADRVERARRAIDGASDEASSAGPFLVGVADALRPLLDPDAAAWLVTDPSTVLFTDGVVDGFLEETCAPWFHHELSVPDVATFRSLASARRTVAVLSHETGGDPSRSARWREVLAPAGLGREMRVAFRDTAGAVWGAATIHRASDRADFDDREAAALTSLAPTIADGLRRIAVRERAATSGPDGPGLLLVDVDGAARPATPAGAQWLDLLGVPHGQHRNTALLTLGALATAGGTAGGRQVRLRTVDGRWVTLHAQPLTGAEGTFAVIVEPSRPADIGVIAAMAYGLSRREQELVLALARGESTERIADGMCISQHTVRDHLKSVFEKTGVSSRNELIAALFQDHYADRFFERITHRN